MAQAEAPRTPKVEAPQAPKVDTPPPQEAHVEKETTPAQDEGKSLVPVATPTKDTHAETQGALAKDAAESPRTPPPGQIVKQISPGKRGSNLKAEAFAEAHSKRVETEAQSYIDSEVRKAEAHAEKLQAQAEAERVREEAKATENLKKEDQRAELVVYTAQMKADKIMTQANEKAVLIKAEAKEAAEKQIAAANKAAEREKAVIEEAKAKKIAEIKDKAETMIASGELPDAIKGVAQRLKENLICNS